MKLGWFLSLSLAGCAVQSSIVRTGGHAAPYTGKVQLVAFAPLTGRELGLVQVSGPRTIDELMPEMSARVAELGGDVGVIDAVKGHFETVRRPQTRQVPCGTKDAPRQCTETVWVEEEVMTVQVLGRALTTGGAP